MFVLNCNDIIKLSAFFFKMNVSAPAITVCQAPSASAITVCQKLSYPLQEHIFVRREHATNLSCTAPALLYRLKVGYDTTC